MVYVYFLISLDFFFPDKTKKPRQEGMVLARADEDSHRHENDGRSSEEVVNNHLAALD